MKPSSENSLGIVEATAYCLGDIIGSGIFVTPSTILKHVNSVGLSLIIWLVAAVISVSGALVYVELGTSIKKSGCDYAYISYAGWHPLAVAFLWVSCALTYPTILAVQTLAFGVYLTDALSHLVCIPLEQQPLLGRLLGFTSLWLLVAVNMYSLGRFAGRFQVVATACKLCVIAFIISTGFYILVFRGGAKEYGSIFAHGTVEPGSVVLGLYAGLFAYNGWDILNFGTEEVENPRRTLPVASLTGIGIAALIYIAMNLSYFSVLSMEEFMESEAVAVKFAEKMLGSYCCIIAFMVAFLLLGNLNTTIFGCSRYLHAGAKNKVVPTVCSTVQPDSMSPRVAVVVEALIATAISFQPDLDWLITRMGITMWMQRSCTQLALLYMRYNNWDFGEDAFRTPIILPALFLVICVALVVIPIVGNYNIGFYGSVAVLVGLAIYFTFVRPRHKPQILYRLDAFFVKLAQILLDVAQPVTIATSAYTVEPLNGMAQNGKIAPVFHTHL